MRRDTVAQSKGRARASKGAGERADHIDAVAVSGCRSAIPVHEESTTTRLHGVLYRPLHGQRVGVNLDSSAACRYLRDMREYTQHQKRIIADYYKNRTDIALARLQEIVTELYVAESDSARDSLWGRAQKAIGALDVPSSIATHILSKRDPQVLARHVRRWLGETASKRGR
ncbi:MAG: hypothetical protein ACE5HE_03230 [Phycisphaerae bacterium]